MCTEKVHWVSWTGYWALGTGHWELGTSTEPHVKKKPLVTSGLLGVVAIFVTTGTSLIPTSLMLGPCLKDRTSAVSYHARVSPLATVDLTSGPVHLRFCYGRPSMKGRKVFGGLVPYGELWRTGANEPTRLYVDHAIQLGSLRVPAGRYSIYSKPTPEQWEVFVTRSVLHWGNDISESVRARELGSFTVPVTALAAPVETLTVSSASGDSASLILEWEQTRVAFPVRPAP
jgi:hypothetical protein